MPVYGNPTPPLVSGNSVRNPILEGYVFQSGIHKPEHSSILTFKYPQYYLTSLFDRLGSSEPVAQDVFSWSILDRTRQGGTVSSTTGVPGTSATFEITEFAFTASTNLGYLIVNDVIRTQTGTLLTVTAVAVSTVLTNKQKVTVAKLDGSSIASTDLADAMVFGHVFNAFSEGSSAPNGRLFLPVEDQNYTHILRRSVNISGSEFTNRTYLGDGSAWYWTLEELNRKEMARDREALILFGEFNNNNSTKTSRGILSWVTANGISTTYAGATGVAESDIWEHIRKLRVEGGSAEYIALCGSTYFKNVQIAMRDYYVGGGVNLGSGAELGLNTSKYNFMGTSVTFVLYELFEDRAIVPYQSTASASLINFSDFSLWLDLGTDSTGKKLFTLKYKEHGGYSRKFLQTIERGMMSPASGGDDSVSSGFDGFRIHMLSEIGIEVRLPNRSGIMRSNS